MQNYNDRFKDAPWYNLNPRIYIGGAGGIGSNTLYCMAKTVPATYFVIDDDIVDSHNIGSQFFSSEDVGKHKVYALQSLFTNLAPTSQINPLIGRVANKSVVLPICISAFDSMSSRKALFEAWKQRGDREILVDGRLRANYYQIFTVLKGQEDKYEATLFDDEDVDEGPCTFKQTAYFGMLIGARITNILVNYLSNKAYGENVTNIPFMIEEMGDLMEIKTEYHEIVS